MASAPEVKTRGITRDQIVALVGSNNRAIKLIESLSSDVSGTLPAYAQGAQTAADNAQASANTAQASANTAQTTANNAATAASNAQTDATSALNQLTTFSAIPFLTLANTGALSSERVLTAGSGISFADGGANTTLTVSLAQNPALQDSGGNNVVQVSATSKLGLYGATPTAQATTAIAGSTFVANAGLAINDASTFDGYTIKQVVKALRLLGILA